MSHSSIVRVCPSTEVSWRLAGTSAAATAGHAICPAAVRTDRLAGPCAGPTGSVSAHAPDRTAPLRGPGLGRRPVGAGARDGKLADDLPRRAGGHGHGLPADAGPPPHLGPVVVADLAGVPLPWTRCGRPIGRRDEFEADRTAAGAEPSPCPRTPPCACWAGPRWPPRPCRPAAISRCWWWTSVDEASGLVRRLQRADVDAVEVPLSAAWARRRRRATCCWSRCRSWAPTR